MSDISDVLNTSAKAYIEFYGPLACVICGKALTGDCYSEPTTHGIKDCGTYGVTVVFCCGDHQVDASTGFMNRLAQEFGAGPVVQNHIWDAPRA